MTITIVREKTPAPLLYAPQNKTPGAVYRGVSGDLVNILQTLKHSVETWHVGVEQARGIFYTTQDTLLLTCRGEGSLLVVEGKREADDHICMMDIGIYT